MRQRQARSYVALLTLLAMGSALAGCAPTGPGGPRPPLAAAAPVLIGAGDIASCASDGDEATARLLDSFPDATIFTVGDNVYQVGSPAEFRDCYDPSWGRHKARTRPSPGNHEYGTANASGYYAYFGDRAGDPATGYYSYDLGTWHLIALNSNLPMTAGSAQEQWLRADLAATTRSCILAYWHAPRFSSGPHGDALAVQPLWDALYAAGADVVIGGHDHTYERFAPQTPTGAPDAARGIREFVVGTGGASHSGRATPRPNSEVFDATTFGVLKLTLGPESYTWEFVPIPGGQFRDSGSAGCHRAGAFNR